MDDTITPRRQITEVFIQHPDTITFDEVDVPVVNKEFENSDVVYRAITNDSSQDLFVGNENRLVGNQEDDDVVNQIVLEMVDRISSALEVKDITSSPVELLVTESGDDVNENTDERDEEVYTVGVAYERKRKKSRVDETIPQYRRFICYWCDQRFRCFSHLKQHVQKHLANNPIRCDVCDRTFTQKSTLKEHMLIHTGERPHRCPRCGKGFTTKTKLRKHIRVHTGERPYSCKFCDATFKSSISIRLHEKKHSATIATSKSNDDSNAVVGVRKLLKCSKCDARFSEKDDLKRHTKDIHVIITNKTANTLSESPINSTDTPNEQITSDSNGASLPAVSEMFGGSVFQCAICQKTFKQKSYLTKHMHRHVGPKYKCAKCGKVYAEKASLVSHIELHNNQQPQVYRCEICSIDFTTASILKRHMTVHVDEAHFECDVCHGKYRSEYLLSRHKRIHWQDRPFKCSMCTSAFVSTSDLKRHIRTHTGEKPYACQHCGQRFTQTSSLRKHREKKHPPNHELQQLQQQQQQEQEQQQQQQQDQHNMDTVQELIQWIDAQAK